MEELFKRVGVCATCTCPQVQKVGCVWLSRIRLFKAGQSGEDWTLGHRRLIFA